MVVNSSIASFHERPEFHLLDIAVSNKEELPSIGIIPTKELPSTIEAISHEKTEILAMVSHLKESPYRFTVRSETIREKYKLADLNTDTLLCKLQSIAIHYFLIERALKEDYKLLSCQFVPCAKIPGVLCTTRTLPQDSINILLQKLLEGKELTPEFVANIAPFINNPSLAVRHMSRNDLILYLLNLTLQEDIDHQLVEEKLENELYTALTTYQRNDDMQESLNSVDQRLAPLYEKRTQLITHLESLVQSKQNLLKKEEHFFREGMDELIGESLKFRNQGQPPKEEIIEHLSEEIVTTRKELLALFFQLFTTHLLKKSFIKNQALHRELF